MKKLTLLSSRCVYTSSKITMELVMQTPLSQRDVPISEVKFWYATVIEHSVQKAKIITSKNSLIAASSYAGFMCAMPHY